MKESCWLNLSIRNNHYKLKIDVRFLINMNYAFQDRENLFLICDLMSGGDLRFHIGRKKRFSEEQTSRIKYLTKYRVYDCMHDCWIGIHA